MKSFFLFLLSVVSLAAMATILLDGAPGAEVVQVAPKSETPKAETPKVVEAPKVVPEASQDEEVGPPSPEMQKVLGELGALKAELARFQSELDATRANPTPAPVEQPAKVEAPKVEAQKVETPPVAETPKAEPQKVEVPTKVALPNCPKPDAHWVDFVVAMHQSKVAPKLPSETKKSLSESIASSEVVKLSEGSKTLSLFLADALTIKYYAPETLLQDHLIAGFNKIRNEQTESFHPEVLAVMRLIQEWQDRGKKNEPNWELVKAATKNAPKEVTVELVKNANAYKQELQTLTTPSLRPKTK
jgi:hypothetical protein